MKAALINNQTHEFYRLVSPGPYWIDLPNGSRVSPTVINWTGCPDDNGIDQFAVVEVVEQDPSTIPADKIIIGTTYEWLDGSIHEIYQLIDVVITAIDIDAERDRRVSAGFMFNGKLFQSRVEDQKRINGAGTLALAAIVSGAQSGNYRWHGGSEDFGWIADDNSIMTMYAQTVMAFGQTAATWESLHVFAGRALKDMNPIPIDYTSNEYWP